MRDTIYRQEAIAAFNTGLNELVVDGEENAKTVVNYLNRIVEKIKCLSSAVDVPETNIGNMVDTISRQAALVAVKDALLAWSYMPEWRDDKILEAIAELPPAQPEIIHCKDCTKHNNGVGDLEVLPDGKRSWIWKDQACPLVSWRGKAQGHEFDYQYCAYAERRTDERPNKQTGGD